MVKSAEVLIFLFLVGLIGMNWPLLKIFDNNIVAYLFSFWLFFIALIAFFTRRFSSVGGPKG